VATAGWKFKSGAARKVILIQTIPIMARTTFIYELIYHEFITMLDGLVHSFQVMDELVDFASHSLGHSVSVSKSGKK